MYDRRGQGVRRGLRRLGHITPAGEAYTGGYTVAQRRDSDTERHVLLMNAINTLMREHKLNSSDFVRIVFLHASNDFLETIRDAIPLERARQNASNWDH